MSAEFLRAATIQELKSKGLLIIEDWGQLFALDNGLPAREAGIDTMAPAC